VTVGVDEFGGCLASGDADDISGGAPFDDVGEHDGGDDEFGCNG